MRKCVIALDIGATKTRAAVVSDNYVILRQIITRTVRNDKDKFMQNIIKIIKQLSFDVDETIAIGAGLPGVIDRKTGYIYDLPNVNVKDIPFGEILFKEFGLPVYIRNDAEVACLAEATLGRGAKYSRVFFITISTGLGGAFCVDGINQDYITEIGHTAYFYHNSWSEYELLASGEGLVRLAKMNDLEIKNARTLFNLLRKNDSKALLIYQDWLEILTSFIELIFNSYHPEIITFTGGVMRNSAYFFRELKAKNPNVRLMKCKFGENAGMIGASVYAFQMVKKD